MNRGAAPAAAQAPKKSCLSEIQRLQKDREERRKAMEQFKNDRAAEDQRNKDQGLSGDVDFMRMIKIYREKQLPGEMIHQPSRDSKICICVRKRPINSKEMARDDADSVSCANPIIVVHDCKLKVDGISKYLDNNSFAFDHTFHEDDSTDNIYDCAVQPLVDFVVGGGRATVFAYGQTGSGKTFTMQGIQKFVADDLFALLQHHQEENGLAIDVFVSYFEIYGGRCQDLLNSRQRLTVREDGNGEVVVADLMELQADNVDALQNIIETGNRNRTTHATDSNDESSRSHAICQIALKLQNPPRNSDGLIGRFSLIDLAGSERGADTKSHNRQRRMEGAEINKSLLALKECIRALDSNSTHVPYRASKLTLVLKDSFTSKKSRTVMIVNVSPAASSADHTLNTLRYADRIKEKTVSQQGQPANGNNLYNNPSQPNLLSSPPPIAAPSLGQNRQRSEPNLPVQPPANPPANKAAAVNAKISKVLAENIAKPAVAPPASSRAAPQAAPQQNFKSPPPAGPAAGPRSNGQLPVGPRGAAQPKGAAAARNPYEHKNAGAKGGSHFGTPDSQDEDFADDFDDYDSESRDRRQKRWEDDDMLDDENSAFHRTVQDVFEEEEDLLNLHMTIIQENAELLTEEGRLLQQIQGENNDIDAYAARLDEILDRKQELISTLRRKLDHFRKSLQKEELESRRARGGY